MILFLDDEKRLMDSYLNELEESLPQHNIEYKSKVDEALEVFRERASQIKLLILDIMMPPGLAFKGTDTRNGLRTGRRFFELVRNEAPEVPVIIFTNVTDPEEEQYYEDQTKCWFFRKEDFSPYELTERVREILSGSSA